MKHWLSGLLAALLLLTLTGCGPVPADAGLADVPFAGAEDKADLPTEDPADLEDTGGPENAENPEALPEEETLPPDSGNAPADNRETEADPLPENGSYTTKEDVALYIHTYGRLPDNFITKKEAQNLGWPGGDLEPYAPGMCIGGSRFGNYEGLLPEAEGRTYTECDIDTLGARSRGAKRIVFSNDGLIYYTEDHYESFELLYGEETDG